MMYKFKSKASGDLLMLGPDGDRLLRLLGRDPAPSGIFGAADLARSIAAHADWHNCGIKASLGYFSTRTRKINEMAAQDAP